MFLRNRAPELTGKNTYPTTDKRRQIALLEKLKKFGSSSYQTEKGEKVTLEDLEVSQLQAVVKRK